jgi:hypothetical protein
MELFLSLPWIGFRSENLNVDMENITQSSSSITAIFVIEPGNLSMFDICSAKLISGRNSDLFLENKE